MYLAGKEVFIKLVEENDVDGLVNFEVRNKEFFQMFTGKREEAFFTPQGQTKRVKSAIHAAAEDRAYMFLVYLKESEEVIGEVALTEVVRGNMQSCWIGYFLDKEHNGKGLMTEAVKLVVQYAFQTLGFHRIEAGVMPHNLGSIKVLLKSGFHKEGIAKKNVRINGQWQDHQTLAIIDEEPEKVGQTVIRSNPEGIAPPIGPYTHLTKVQRNAELFVLSGQVGTDKEGNVPVELIEQLKNTLSNIEKILASEQVPFQNIIKVNIWATEDIQPDSFHQIWEDFHGGEAPSMTLAYISKLGVPSLKIEIEIWAAK